MFNPRYVLVKAPAIAKAAAFLNFAEAPNIA
jgi:hypothetical protein